MMKSVTKQRFSARRVVYTTLTLIILLGVYAFGYWFLRLIRIEYYDPPEPPRLHFTSSRTWDDPLYYLYFPAIRIDHAITGLIPARCPGMFICPGIEQVKGNHPVHVAAEKGDLQAVQGLMSHDRELLNRQNNVGWSPLYIAARRGHAEMARWLIGEGADVELADKYRETPLHTAAYGNHMEIVQILVEQGVNVNRRGCYGSSALYSAAAIVNDNYSLT